MKKRTQGHTETMISGDTRAEWSEAFTLVPGRGGVRVARIEVYTGSPQPRFAPDRLSSLPADYLEQRPSRAHANALLVPARTVLDKPVKNAPWFGKPGENSTIWESPSPKFVLGGSEEDKFDHPTQKPVELMRRPILNHTRRGELVYGPFLGSGTTLAAAETTERVCLGMEIDPKYVDVVIKRWQQLTGKQAVLESDGRTFEDISIAQGPGR